MGSQSSFRFEENQNWSSPERAPDAAAALREEYAAGKPGTGNSSSGDKPLAISRVEERQTREYQEFHRRYENDNFTLAPLKPGQGPFQSLEQMVKEQKISMTPEEIHAESKRIRNRDFKELGRDYYTTSDSIKRWSDREIEERVKDTVNKVKGIDVSAHQGAIDWKQVKDAGYQFAFLKATEGIDWVDSTFQTNRAAAREAGLKVGYYHYFRPNDTVEEQVKNFVGTVGKAEPDALRVVIDTEDERIWKPYSVEQRVKMITQWCEQVKKQLGVEPSVLIYGSPNFFNSMLQNSAKLGAYDLWIANYNVAEPTVPKPWSKWTYWQFSEHGKVPGINNGDVDLNVYNGTDPSIGSRSKSRRP